MVSQISFCLKRLLLLLLLLSLFSSFLRSYSNRYGQLKTLKCNSFISFFNRRDTSFLKKFHANKNKVQISDD